MNPKADRFAPVCRLSWQQEAPGGSWKAVAVDILSPCQQLRWQGKPALRAVGVKQRVDANEAPEGQQDQEPDAGEPLDPAEFPLGRVEQFGVTGVLSNAVLAAYVVDEIDQGHTEGRAQDGAHLPRPQLPIDQQQIAERCEQRVPFEHRAVEDQVGTRECQQR